MAETIQIYNKNGGLVYALTPNERCKRFYQLMGEDYISLEFKEAYRPSYPRPHQTPARAIAPPVFHIGDWCEVEGEKFVLNERQMPTYDESTGAYNYTLRMVAQYRTWSNYVVKEIAKDDTGAHVISSAIFKYTATLSLHARALLQVLALNGFYPENEIEGGKLDKYVNIHADHFETTQRDKENKLMAYEGQNVLEAIETLCSAEMYDCEWWVTLKGGKYTLHFGRRENASSDAFSIQTGVNAASIREEQSQNEFANRIFVFGGTQNVPYSYRKKLLFTQANAGGASLTDTYRPLEHEMFERNARQTLYDCDRIESRKTYKELENNRNKETFLLIEKDQLPAGRYKLEAFCIEHLLDLSGMTYKGFLTTLYYTLRGTATINGENKPIFKERTFNHTITRIGERYAREGDEWPSAEGSKSVTDIPENDKIILEATAKNVRITLQVDFVLDTAYTNQNTESLDFWITGTGNAMFQRIDLFIADCVVTKYPTGETSHAEFQESTHFGTNAVIPDYPERLNMRQGDQYQVDGLIYNRVKQHYYTSDKGDDVINGFNEVRLNLPEDATTEEGVICRNGYVEKVDTAESIVEKVIIHDDIFPSEVSMIVQDYTTEKRPAKMVYPDSSVSEREYDVYIIRDTYINNNPRNEFKKDYILDGVTLQVKFKTGDLAGMTFDVEFNNERGNDGYTQTYLIIPNTEYGALFPNDVLHPRRGDEMLLIGWDCNAIEGLGMVAKAEQLLLAAALDDLEAATKGSRTYRAQMLSNTEFINARLKDKDGAELKDARGDQLTSKDVRGEDNLQVGQLVTLTDYALFDEQNRFESEPLRVIGYEAALDYPWDRPQYIIGEIPKPTRRQMVESLTKQIKTK